MTATMEARLSEHMEPLVASLNEGKIQNAALAAQLRARDKL